MDLTAHGRSDPINNQMHTIDDFRTFSDDLIKAIEEIYIKTQRSIYIVGISLGGLIVTCALNTLLMEERLLSSLSGENKQNTFEVISGVTLLAPCLSITRQLESKTNRLLSFFAPLVAKALPNIRVVKKDMHATYPHLDQHISEDVLCGPDMISASLGNEIYNCTFGIETSLLNIALDTRKDFHIHIVHSEADGFVYPDGSKKFEKLLKESNKDVFLELLPKELGLWHYLTLEPGTQIVLDKVMLQIAEVERKTKTSEERPL